MRLCPSYRVNTSGEYYPFTNSLFGFYINMIAVFTHSDYNKYWKFDQYSKTFWLQGEKYMRRINIKATAAAIAAVLSLSCSAAVFAEIPGDGQTDAESFASQNGISADWESWKDAWETEKNDWTKVSIAPGTDESELNFAWYSKTESVVFSVSKNADMSEPVFSETVNGAADEILMQNGEQLYGCKTTVGNLNAGVYYYKIGDADAVSFEVKDASDGFSFIFVGDPQIGSSNSMKGSKVTDDETAAEFYAAQSDAVRSDAFNWNNTLNNALENNDDISFVLSAGDQIQSRTKDAPANKTDNTYSEIEYAGFLSAEALRSLPLAPTVGNHDATLANYSYHFNTPNSSELGSNGIVGGDYWFTYGNALFIMLNTQDTNTAEHKQFIEEAVSANPDCAWRFVTLHQDIYGSAEHSNEPEITNLRYELVPYFEENDIDAVFTGHDHAYSRSYLLCGGEKTDTYYDGNEDEYDEMFEYDIDGAEDDRCVFTAYGQIQSDTTDEKKRAYLNYLEAIEDKDAIEETDSEVAVNPEGILYMTANSSSGSKYYDLTSRMQSYVANRWQEDVPTYSIVEVTDTEFTINTYRTDTNEKIDTEFSIVKQDENNGGDDNNNSVPDDTKKNESSKPDSDDSTSSENGSGSSETSSVNSSSASSTVSSSNSSSGSSTQNPKTGLGDGLTAVGLLSAAAAFIAVGLKKIKK